MHVGEGVVFLVYACCVCVKHQNGERVLNGGVVCAATPHDVPHSRADISDRAMRTPSLIGVRGGRRLLTFQEGQTHQANADSLCSVTLPGSAHPPPTTPCPPVLPPSRRAEYFHVLRL